MNRPLALAVLFSFCAACAPAKKSADEAAPQQLTFTPQSAQTSPEEAKRLTDLLSSAKVTSVSKFHLKSPDEDAEDRQERETRWSRLTAPLKDRMNTIPHLCELLHPRQTILEEAKPEVGSRNFSTETAAIRGQKCPVREENSSSTEGVITSINQDSSAYTMKMTRTQSSKAEMLDADWIKETGMRSQSMNMAMQGSLAWAGADKVNTMHMTATAAGEFVLATGEKITMTASMEYLLRGTADRSRNELILHLSLTDALATLPISVQIITEPRSTKTVRAFVNGLERPLEELEGLIGSVQP